MGCSAPGASEGESSSAVTATVESPAVKMFSDEAESVAAARTVNNFYAYVSNPSNLAGVEKASEKITGDGKDVTDEELKALVEALPLGFQYFDTSSPDLIKNAYVQLAMGARIMSRGTMKLSAPATAFTIEGNTATVDISKTETVLNGKKFEAPANSSMSALKLKKNDAGSWVMVAEGVPGLTVSNGFAAAVSGSSAKK
jgi:hypothetical protein